MGKLSFIIYVTTKCNMNCSYCYEKEYVPLDMSMTTAYKVISFVYEKIIVQKANIVYIQFHGGEPLLNISVIQFLVDELEKGAATANVTFYYSMTTNATLYKDEMKPILRKFRDISVSIDGREKVHNQSRVFNNQEGTYATVKNNIEKLMKVLPRVIGRMTVLPNTYKEVYFNFLHIIELGIKNIEIELDFTGDEWTEEMIEEYVMELKKIADKVIEKKSEINIDVPLLRASKEKPKNSICNGGRTSFTITPDGKIYPCLVTISRKDFLLGEIGEPLDENILDKIVKAAKIENPSCSGCSRYDYCNGTRCKIVNFTYNGDYHLPSPITCVNEHIKTEVGKYFLNRPYN